MIEVELAAAADIAGIERCLRSAFEPYRTRYTPGAYADTVLTDQGVRARLETMIVLVAKPDSGIVAGTVSGRVHGSEGHLRGMAVLADWQRKGVGQRLLAQIESRLAAAGCRVVSLDTTQPLTHAMAFYERNGYRPSGFVRDFFGMPLHEYRKRL